MLTTYEIAATWAEGALDSADYGQGIVEDAQQRALNNSRAIGRLIGVLYAKKFLTKDEVRIILNDPSDCNEEDFPL